MIVGFEAGYSSPIKRVIFEGQVFSVLSYKHFSPNKYFIHRHYNHWRFMLEIGKL